MVGKRKSGKLGNARVRDRPFSLSPKSSKGCTNFYQFPHKMSEKRNPKCFFDISIGGEKGRLMNFFLSV